MRDSKGPITSSALNKNDEKILSYRFFGVTSKKTTSFLNGKRDRQSKQSPLCKMEQVLMQDGAPPHIALPVQHLMRSTFRRITLSATTLMTKDSRSLDLTP
ncbi:hypothetical protein TNCT_327931 [Trichonephila clavata]|uniref:Transposase n=1 Tax=Trichonephila clavata TaxID=2740835 RepID=A0A8X6HJV3_TRICU|nr:hypothetical protein TNCT_327931 [Trichonephila clavata]